MLKRLAIFTATVLIIAFQAYAQTNQTRQTENGQKPAHQAADIAAQQQSGQHLEGKDQQHIDADVKVVTLPTKDWQDKTSFWITALLALVGMGTLFYLNGQVGQMKRQALLMEGQLKEMEGSGEIAKRAAEAADQSAKAAFLQIQMMKDKERARVEVKALGLELEHEGEEFWNLKATIQIRNIGMGRAYVQHAVGDLVATLSEEPETESWNLLNIDGDLIDPDGKPITEFLYFFQVEKLDPSDFVKKISDGRLPLRITGCIEYDTVGTTFHRDFGYTWIGFNNLVSVAAMLHPAGSEPRTNNERVSAGYWRQTANLKNSEYEIQTKSDTTET